MNWIRNFVKPKLKALINKEVPENLWHKCPDCEQMLFHRDLKNNLNVCKNCQYHFRFEPAERLAALYDNQTYQRIPLPAVLKDPLHFKDLKKYTDRLKESRQKTNEEDALIVAQGFIAGRKVITALFNFEFMGGSMGLAVGEGIVKAAEVAATNNAALLIIPASGGARMQEGILSLMQMARTTIAIQRVKEKRLPYLVLLTNPTTGGVTASFAMLGDITLAEPKATICFAGRRVIEQTIKQQLPKEFQTSEYLLAHGMVDCVVHRQELPQKLRQILSMLMPQVKAA